MLETKPAHAQQDEYAVPAKSVREFALFRLYEFWRAIVQADRRRSASGHDAISPGVSEKDKAHASRVIGKLQSIHFSLSTASSPEMMDEETLRREQVRQAWGNEAYLKQILTMPETGAFNVLADICGVSTAYNLSSHEDQGNQALVTIADYTLRELADVFTKLGEFTEDGNRIPLRWEVRGNLLPLGEGTLNAEILSSYMLEQLVDLLERSVLNAELFIHTAQTIINLCQLIPSNAEASTIMPERTANALVRAIDACRGNGSLVPCISDLYARVVFNPKLRRVFDSHITQIGYERAQTPAPSKQSED